MKLFLVLIILHVILLGCATSTRNTPPDAVEEGRDTTTRTPMPTATPALAPGTAQVVTIVRSAEAVNDTYRCMLEVKEVQGYGSSTPPLPVGAEVEVLMRKSVFGEDPEGTVAAEHLQAGRSLTVTMKHQRIAEGSPPWVVVKLH